MVQCKKLSADCAVKFSILTQTIIYMILQKVENLLRLYMTISSKNVLRPLNEIGGNENMFTAMFPELIYGYLNEDTLGELENSSEVRKSIFGKLTVGVNVTSIEVYQDIAVWLLTVPEEELKEITMEDVIKEVGEYVDTSGYLV